MVDVTNNGELTLESLKHFLKLNEYYDDDKLVISVIRRIDKNDDMKINLMDFTHFILPSDS